MKKDWYESEAFNQNFHLFPFASAGIHKKRPQKHSSEHLRLIAIPTGHNKTFEIC